MPTTGQTISGALLQQALQLHQSGRLRQALPLYQRILDASPAHFDALHLLGVAYYQLGDLERAAGLVARAVQVDANNPHAWSNRGNIERELGRADLALDCYDRALALKPDFAEVHYNRGNLLHEMGRQAEAVAAYDRAIALKLDYAEAFNNRGNVLRQLRRLDESRQSLDRALALRPDRADVRNNRGVVLLEQRHYAAALADFDAAIALRPGNAEAHYNRGKTLFEMRRAKAALESYDAAVGLKSDYADAWYNRGNALRELKLPEAALESYDRAIAIAPELRWSHVGRLSTAMQVCDWSDFDRQLAGLLEAIDRGEPLAPFPILALTDSPEVLLRAARARALSNYVGDAPLPALPAAKPAGTRLRIGYYSADFCTHATSLLMAGLFEQHDRSRVELFGFSFTSDADDELGRRVSAAFDRMLDVRDASAHEIARMSRELGIDIAIDLKGYTLDSRPEIFAHRAAPIQVSYLGYPATMGAEFIDYLIADRIVVPAGAEAGYSEKIVRLPHSYQVNDDRRPISPDCPSRAEAGLPESGVVFCCFNASYKIVPEMFDRWMRILDAVEGSALWLIDGGQTAAANLRREAAQRGLDPARLVFAPRAQSPDHLARHRLADLFLDTLPYNAHTTASDALWAGLPVLTLPGRSFAARVAASLLAALDLPELIAQDGEEYEALAIALARDPARLGAVRQRLLANRTTAPLFDTKRTARHLEDAYLAMYERFGAGLAPDHIDIMP